MSKRIGGLWMAALMAAGGLLWVPLLEAQERAEAEAYSLGRAIRVALANSRILEDAEFGLKGADEQVREAWSSVLPDVSARASYRRNLQVQEAFLPAFIFDPNASPDELIPVKFGQENAWVAGVSLSQPLFEAGAFIGVGAAGRFRALHQEMVRGTTQQVVTAVRQAYFDALAAAEALRLTEESIERIRQTLEETQAMNRAGLVSDYDVLRLEVQLSELQANLLGAENAVRAAQRNLAVDMGLDPGTPITIEGRLNEVDLEDPGANDAANAELLRLAGASGVVDGTFDAAITEALRRRSDLKQIRSNILLEEARVSVEKAEFFPTVSIFSTYEILAQEPGSPSFFGESSNQRTTQAFAGLSIELPIFRGFSRSARVQQAQAAVRQNVSRLERAEQEASNEVRTLFDDVLEALKRAESQRRAVAQAQRGFEIASAEFRAGIGTRLQVTEAEVALRQTEFNYARAVYDYLTARGQLDLALGTVPERVGEGT